MVFSQTKRPLGENQRLEKECKNNQGLPDQYYPVRAK